MIRIKDIADRAGVSPTTVSNVIHGKTGRVSKATVEKINRILKEMEYVPSISARMLADKQNLKAGEETTLRVVLVKPEKFENASDIADHLREKRTVVLNLESTNKDIARRLIDFLSGVAYAQEGKIKKISAATYIITPYNVDIIGDLIDELENSGLYF